MPNMHFTEFKVCYFTTVLSSCLNPTRLPLLREKTGALAIVELGITAGRQADRFLFTKLLFRRMFIHSAMVLLLSFIN